MVMSFEALCVARRSAINSSAYIAGVRGSEQAGGRVGRRGAGHAQAAWVQTVAPARKPST